MEPPDKPRPGRRPPLSIEDFSSSSTLSDAEKQYIADVNKIIYADGDHGNLRNLIRWTEHHPRRPDWIPASPSSLKNMFCSTLSWSSRRLPQWPMVEWIIASSINDPGSRTKIEFSMARRYLELTGTYPAGYVARSLPGHAHLTTDNAPDLRTKTRLLELELERKNQAINRAAKQVRQAPEVTANGSGLQIIITGDTTGPVTVIGTQWVQGDHNTIAGCNVTATAPTGPSIKDGQRAGARKQWFFTGLIAMAGIILAVMMMLVILQQKY